MRREKLRKKVQMHLQLYFLARAFFQRKERECTPKEKTRVMGQRGSMRDRGKEFWLLRGEKRREDESCLFMGTY
jgi:hypothetical protein